MRTFIEPALSVDDHTGSRGERRGVFAGQQKTETSPRIVKRPRPKTL